MADKTIEEVKSEILSKVEEGNESLKKIEEGLSEKASVEELQKVKKDIEGINSEFQKFSHIEDKTIIEYLKGMQEQNNTIESKVNDLLEGKGAPDKNMRSQLDDILKGDDYQKIAKTMSKSRDWPSGVKDFSINLEMKTDDMTSSNSLTETNDQIPQTQRLPGDIVVPRRPTLLYDLFPKAVATSDIITWVELTSETQGASTTSEGSEFGQSDADWTSYKQGVEKITNYIKISREMLEDIDFVRSRISELLNTHLADTREDELLSGSGTSPHLKGIDESAKSFTLSDFAGVTNPNNYDAIMAVLTQIALGDTSNDLATGFIGTDIILNPVDFLATQLEKDSNNNYVFPPGMFSNGTFAIGGANVRQSQRIGAGYYLGGDFNRGRIYLKRNMQIRMWEQNEDDAIKDYVTFTASQRLALVVSNIEAYAFAYDELEDVKTAIVPA